MPKRILIDATHIEETRSVILENGRVREFDSETSIKNQLKGNVYLGKITRVEPSLQAAFVDYGGEKHGFLPFSEIHPDYYAIPVSDKEEILRSMRQDSSDHDDDIMEKGKDKSSSRKAPYQKKEASQDDAEISHSSGDEHHHDDHAHEDEHLEHKDDGVEVIEGDEDLEIKGKKSDFYRRYKIQEVIKRNQIVLVQVEKEERGNKGASLTTFISLAGRYCVLMPNSLRHGGVSRRIGSYEDRKRLKSILDGLNIPKEAGIIIRTAGAAKDEKEIKNDYDYLAGLWNKIREKTLSSNAPAFIHTEGDIIRRVIRDMYDETVDEVLIEGKNAFTSAKDFMKEMLPSHVGNVKPYKNKVPIFSRYKVEEQISMLYQPSVPLTSGGSIVLNPTEALISIDVNSGKSTSQRNVEETALATNLEAAYEIARQLKLRDLSGLIVIDFIDMLELRNRKAVERALKDAFQDDRAKIQIGRISSFGLLEMSRQRLRASFLEVNTKICSHCNGAGVVKAPESISINVLRAIEGEVSRSTNKSGDIIEANVAIDVAVYILNNKRREVSNIEEFYGTRIIIKADNLIQDDSFTIKKLRNNGEYAREDKQSENKEHVKEQTDFENAEVQEDVSSETNDRRSNKRNVRKEKTDKKEEKVNNSVKASSIFEGIWQKIID